MSRHRYTREEIDYVVHTLRKYESYEDFTGAFNAKFGTDVSPGSISDLCIKRLKYPIGKSRTRYTAGDRSRALPVGTVRRTDGGYAYVKVSDSLSHFSGYREPDWVPLQKKIWTDVHGPIPDGYMICFLNGNRSDLSPKNLCCISRKVSAQLSKNGWWSSNPDITLAGIRYAELMIAMKGEKHG